MKEISEEQAFRIRRNLQDAGCTAAMVTQFLEWEENCSRSEQYRMLSCHKSTLLQKLHRIQYKIDCLDHLVYIMQQKEEQERRIQSCKTHTL